MDFVFLTDPAAQVDPSFCGGGHRIAIETARALRHLGSAAHVVGFFTRPDRLSYLISGASSESARTAYGEAQIREAAPDVVVAMNFVPEIAWEAPTVIYFCHERTREEWMHEVGVSRVDGYIFHSHWLEDSFRRSFPDAASCVIRGAVDPGHFVGRSRQSSSKRVRVTFAGALLAEKGVLDVVDAWQDLEPSNAELVIAGKSTLWGNTVGTPVSEGELQGPNIAVLGPVSYADMPELWCSTDIMVMPSRFRECLPLTLVEAIACGCDVVCSNVDGNMEVTRGGRLASLYEPGDVVRLSAVLGLRIDALHAGRTEQDYDVRRRVALEHSWITAANSLLAVLHAWL